VPRILFGCLSRVPSAYQRYSGDATRRLAADKSSENWQKHHPRLSFSHRLLNFLSSKHFLVTLSWLCSRLSTFRNAKSKLKPISYENCFVVFHSTYTLHDFALVTDRVCSRSIRHNCCGPWSFLTGAHHRAVDQYTLSVAFKTVADYSYDVLPTDSIQTNRT